MSWTIQVTVATAASGGDVPISDATVTWKDGNKTGSQNNSQYFSTSNPAGTMPITVNEVSSTNFTASCNNFSPQTLPADASSGSLLFELNATSGTGSASGGCFIVTAAFGSESAPEVELLQAFRDNVLRRTRWGSKFFDELYKYYYRVSPAIADEMIRDPQLRQVLRFAIVEPWVNYMQLTMARPDLKSMNLDSLDPTLRDFLLRFQACSDRWIKGIELPTSFKGRDPMESVDELNIILGMVLLRTDGRVYLDDLVKRGELPIRYREQDEAKLRSALINAGRTEDEIASVLHDADRS